MKTLPKVLVVTLYSGENEYESCKNSVSQQVGVNLVHKTIEFQPKQKAHQDLYRIFNENNKKFDYFAKLDADMAFANPNALLNIISEFQSGIDVVSATVYDGMTNTDMQSFNVFSKNCKFQQDSNHPLFTDQVEISYPGYHKSFVDNERNVLHAFNPSPFQAFMFGVHRALKVIQPGVKSPRLNDSYHQAIILNKTYKFWLESKSEHLKYALWGASLVYQGAIETPALYKKSDYLDTFDKLYRNGGMRFDSRLNNRDLFSLIELLGFYRFSIGVFLQICKKLKLKF